jgi:hypothetical protein
MGKLIDFGEYKKRKFQELDDTETISDTFVYKSEPTGILGTVFKIFDAWAGSKSPSYKRARTFGKYATGEESIPTAREFAYSAYKQYVEKPAKKRARDIVFKRGGKYATDRFDERVIRYAVLNYIKGISEVPFIPKERIEYEGKDVWGFQDGKKIEYLPAYKIRKDLGEYSEKIREEVGLDTSQFDKALEHYVKIHELAEKRLSEYVGQLSEEQHGWLQAKVVDYLRSSEAEAARKVGEVGFRIDSLRTGEFGKSIRKYRLAA